METPTNPPTAPSTTHAAMPDAVPHAAAPAPPIPAPAPAPAPVPVKVGDPSRPPPEVTLPPGTTLPPLVYNPKLAPAAPPDRLYGCTRLCAVQFANADPTGKTDTTAAIQKAIDSLPLKDGGEVHLPAGDYLIDPAVSIKLRSNMFFNMDPGARLVAKASDLAKTGMLEIIGINNVRVRASLFGDRDVHVFSKQKTTALDTHEWGHGIRLYGSSHITIEDSLLSHCTGDGCSISDYTDSSGAKLVANDIYFKNTISTDNRRQGVSFGKCTNVIYQGGELRNTNGTAPQDGIDIEPENGGSAENIHLDGVWIHSNMANGIEGQQRTNVDSPVKGITVTNCRIEYNHACGLYLGKIQGVDVFNNRITCNGQSGMNLSTVTTAVHVAGNTWGFNYNRGNPVTKDRPDVSVAGVQPKFESDVLARNPAAENNFELNTYI